MAPNLGRSEPPAAAGRQLSAGSVRRRSERLSTSTQIFLERLADSGTWTLVGKRIRGAPQSVYDHPNRTLYALLTGELLPGFVDRVGSRGLAPSPSRAIQGYSKIMPPAEWTWMRADEFAVLDWARSEVPELIGEGFQSELPRLLALADEVATREQARFLLCNR